MGVENQRATHEHADKDGHFRRKESVFRGKISSDPSSKFPAEKGRYVLYCNLGCPWAHRTILVRSLKGLENIIQIAYTDFILTDKGWIFSGKNGSDERDPLYGFAGMKQLYLKADPEYSGRYTVPALWDRKHETIVNNESSEIIRMLYTEFDALISPELREVSKGRKGLFPEHLRSEIDAMNEWVYSTVNNGVYKCGFATTQDAYNANIVPLFDSLDRLEAHLSNPEACHGGPFLLGPDLTEVDIRLYTTMARFDPAYYTIFQCSIKSLRSDYPRLFRWFRRIYWNASDIPGGKVFKDTVFPEVYRNGYAYARARQLDPRNPSPIVPGGPDSEVYGTWTSDDEDIDNGRLVALRTIKEKSGLDSEATTPTLSTSATVKEASLSGVATNEVKRNGKTDLTSESRLARTDAASGPSRVVLATAAQNGDAQDPHDPPPGLARSSTTQYEDQNAKWYKAARKAEKKSGAPSVHLAL